MYIAIYTGPLFKRVLDIEDSGHENNSRAHNVSSALTSTRLGKLRAELSFPVILRDMLVSFGTENSTFLQALCVALNHLACNCPFSEPDCLVSSSTVSNQD